MKFDLIKTDYQREIYQALFTWKNICLVAQVSMQYHTFLRFWDVEYLILYGKNYSYGTPDINRKSDITGRNGRKTARAFAMKYMEDAVSDDVEKLGRFYQNQILKNKV